MEIPPEEYKALVQQIIMLQSRVDALSAYAQTFAMGHGATSEKFQDALQTLIQTFYQKRLERIEEQSPSLAALIAEGMHLPKVDQSLLDQMRFDDEP